MTRHLDAKVLVAWSNRARAIDALNAIASRRGTLTLREVQRAEEAHAVVELLGERFVADHEPTAARAVAAHGGVWIQSKASALPYRIPA